MERRKKPPAQRFMKFVSIDHGTGCWIWTGGKTQSGYANFWYRGRTRRASRVSLELFRGEVIPNHLLACHTCDNPNCVNPDHLFIGNASDNALDALRKGRLDLSPRVSLPGASNPSAKLTEQQAREILKLRRSGQLAKDIAPLYGVGLQIIYNITNGVSWKHLHASSAQERPPKADGGVVDIPPGAD